ncbi:MAG: hypothetical protein HY701_00650 [Gemmatimonadetes bacterium]|nr:hypothetical protein [Gemmatimonadota bacterium]
MRPPVRLEDRLAGLSAEVPTVLLVGGLAGGDDSARVVAEALQAFDRLPRERHDLRCWQSPVFPPFVRDPGRPSTAHCCGADRADHRLDRFSAAGP